MISSNSSTTDVLTALELGKLNGVQGIALADPDSVEVEGAAGQLVLGVGFSESMAPGLISAAARAGAAALVLRRAADSAATDLLDLARTASVALYWLPSTFDWTETHRRLVDALGTTRPGPVVADDELAGLAQTIATLTGGLVTIEDTNSRVLAYSRSNDEVDDLRRLSILGRSGPEEYLALLREWGVYDRLAATEDVVEIAEHPEFGVRRRLAVGVFAGGRQLATIWVQQGVADFPARARQALVGAARVTAAQLIARRHRPAGGTAGDALQALLAGRGSAEALGLGRTARKPSAVVAFSLGDQVGPSDAGQLATEDLLGIVNIHAASFRREFVATILDRRVYLLLPNLESADAAVGPVRQAVTAARHHLNAAAQAAIGPVVDSIAAAADSRHGADEALAVAENHSVVTFDTLRAVLAVDVAARALVERPELSEPALERLIADEHDLAKTLLKHLESGSDVGRVAELLHIHPTTVRYRLRRASELLDIDLDEPDRRLALHLELRAALRGSQSGA